MTEELQKEAAEFPELNPPYPGTYNFPKILLISYYCQLFKNISCNSFILGRICCTQFEDGIWYRGLVIDRRGPNNCVPVFYIDYGNVSYTPVSE